MANIKIIAAIGKNLELGKNNDLIWHLKEDLKFFKSVTMGHTVVMGYNTFISLPHLLPGRKHIILSDKELNNEEVKVFNDFNTLVSYLESLDEDIYIIGGASIYRLFISLADELILTLIDAECKDADVYFPEYKKEDYEEELIKEINDEDPTYKHVVLRRKK